MVDAWLLNNLPPDPVRRSLFGAYVRRVFGGIGEQQVVTLLTALNVGGQVLEWEGRFSQLAREGVTGTTATTGFDALLTGQQSLTGVELNAFWAAALGPTGRSELVMRCVQQLSGPTSPLSGQQIRDLILLFLSGTACTACAQPNRKLILTKSQLLTALTDLRSKFTPQQVWTFCLFFQVNLPATVAPEVTPKKFLTMCRDVRATTRTGHDLIQVINAHGNLTNSQLAVLLFHGSLGYTVEFLATVLPQVPQLPNNVNDPPSLLSYAISRGTAAAVAEVLAEATKADKADKADNGVGMSCTVTARLLIHLQRMTAGDRVIRLVRFIERADPARKARGRKHTWVEVMDLIDQFVADNRHNQDPATVPVGNAIVGVSCRCTGERIAYFLTAHTFGWFNFHIVDRTKDEITMFPPGTTLGGMRVLVQNALVNVDVEMVQDVLASDRMGIFTVGAHEIGLVKQRNGNTVALVHFMPFSLNPADYWHKDLLSAIGPLFPH
jgi:hypothetical protein